MDNTYGLLAVQEMNLEILKEIDRICSKYGISYMLDAGSLIGAIRHNGFIPWDDDADIAMSRENWEIFKRVLRKELPAHMCLLLPEGMRGGRAFYDFTPRILYKQSRRHPATPEDEYYEHRLNHVWVDVFILDRIPKNRIAAGLVRLLQKKIYLLSMGHRYRIDYRKYGILHKPLVFIFSHLGRLWPMRFLFGLQEGLSVLFQKLPCKNLYYSNYQPDYLHITLKREWIGKMIRISFEDTQLCVPEHYEEILSLVYGDYMKLPPRNKRKPTHGSTEIIRTDTK